MSFVSVKHSVKKQSREESWKKKISVVPNAVDAEVVRNESDLLHEMKKKLDQKLVVGYIGSLRELEGVDLTAEAVSILNKRGVDVNFFVLSSQSGQDELRAYCDNLGIAENTDIVGASSPRSGCPHSTI